MCISVRENQFNGCAEKAAKPLCLYLNVMLDFARHGIEHLDAKFRQAE
jgi:hypothetical protein